MNINNITFSIIMPCYNSEEYLDAAVNSVINQSYPHWELIAVNDGSKDKTLDMLNKYAEKDPRIKVFSKENGGYASAVNYGLDRISSDYFLLMGSDDSLSVELFYEIHKNISTLPKLPDCIAFKTSIQYGQTSQIDSLTRFDTIAFDQNSSIKEYSEKHPDHSKIFFARDTSKCFKRELLEDLRYFGRFGIDADGIFSMLFCHKARSFASIPHVGYYWVLRECSVSSSSTISLEKNFDRLENWQKFYNELEKLEISEISKKEIDYLSFPTSILFELLLTSSIARKHSRFIKRCIRNLNKYKKRYNVENNNIRFKIFLFSATLYSIVDKIHSVLFKKNNK